MKRKKIIEEITGDDVIIHYTNIPIKNNNEVVKSSQGEELYTSEANHVLIYYSTVAENGDEKITPIHLRVNDLKIINEMIDKINDLKIINEMIDKINTTTCFK